MTIHLPMAPVDLQFQVTRNDSPMPEAEREAILADPPFGSVFTDHMVDICWSEKGGWHRPRVQPYGPIPMDPAAAVLHYGQEIFEGLKAYRHRDGSIWSFRPEQNALRMQRSAKRMALPELPVEYFLQSLRELIAVDGAWVPSAPEMSLYLRPYMYAKEAFLGVRAAKKVAYYLIAAPAGPLFQWRGQACVDLALHRLFAGWQGRDRKGKNRRQLRRVIGGSSRSRQTRLCAGTLSRLSRWPPH